MELIKTNLNFNDLMTINVKLHRGQLKNTIINEELAKEIQGKMFAVTKTRGTASITNIETIVKNQKCELHWTINNGWTCMYAKGVLLGDILCITKENQDTNKKDNYYFKIKY